MPTTADAATVYRSLALAECWRIAALVDRNGHSATRGSLSRTHWAWKFDDFPYPRLQEGVYALCRLHDLSGRDNPMHGSPAVARWIEWAFEYWTTLQHGNGSFDEAYPFEQCLSATAFTSFYVGQAFLAWRERLPAPLRERVAATLVRAGEWLCRNEETHGILSNHLAAAVAGLATVGEATGDERFRARAGVFLDVILQHQSSEGWMQEYDGADIGYGTHAFFYLAAYWRMTRSEQALGALRAFARFLTWFVHPDGTLGGEYASRNTEFAYPAGFEILAREIPECATLARFFRRSVASRTVCGVWSMDVFNFFPMYNNLLFALDAARDLPSGPPLPHETSGEGRYFPHAGLWVVNRESYYAIVGVSKGGTVSVFDKRTGHLTARHAGLVAFAGASTFTSQDHTLQPSVTWETPVTARFPVPWKRLRIPVFGPWLFLGFRLFTLTVGRSARVSRWLKERLVAVLIRNKRRPPVRHVRTVEAGPDTVTIRDEIDLPRSFRRVQALEQFASIHMGSAMYADVRSIGPSGGCVEFPAAGRLRLRGTLSLDGTRWVAED